MGPLKGRGGGAPMSPVGFKKCLSHYMSLSLICAHVTYRIQGPFACHYIFLKTCRMSIRPMSHVKFKKLPCCPVEFRGRGPCLSTIMSSKSANASFPWFHKSPWGPIYIPTAKGGGVSKLIHISQYLFRYTSLWTFPGDVPLCKLQNGCPLHSVSGLGWQQ